MMYVRTSTLSTTCIVCKGLKFCYTLIANENFDGMLYKIAHEMQGRGCVYHLTVKCNTLFVVQYSKTLQCQYFRQYIFNNQSKVNEQYYINDSYRLCKRCVIFYTKEMWFMSKQCCMWETCCSSTLQGKYELCFFYLFYS